MCLNNLPLAGNSESTFSVLCHLLEFTTINQASPWGIWFPQQGHMWMLCQYLQNDPSALLSPSESVILTPGTPRQCFREENAWGRGGQWNGKSAQRFLRQKRRWRGNVREGTRRMEPSHPVAAREVNDSVGNLCHLGSACACACALEGPKSLRPQKSDKTGRCFLRCHKINKRRKI